jgi:hypothetical protein
VGGGGGGRQSVACLKLAFQVNLKIKKDLVISKFLQTVVKEFKGARFFKRQ